MKIYTEGLMSKHGFQDGDIFDDLLYDAGLEGRRSLMSLADEHDALWEIEHVTLIVVVTALVLPRLDQKIDVWLVSSIHNPIRADSVDGVKLDWSNFRPEPFVLPTPEFIEVPDEVIVAIARNLATPQDI